MPFQEQSLNFKKPKVFEKIRLGFWIFYGTLIPFWLESNPRHGNTWVEPLSLVLDELCQKFVLSHHSSLHNVLCYGSTRTQIMLKHSFFDLKLEPLEDRRKNRKSIVSTQLAGSDLSVRLQTSKSVLCVLFLLDKNWQALIWVDRHLCKTIML